MATLPVNDRTIAGSARRPRSGVDAALRDVSGRAARRASGLVGRSPTWAAPGASLVAAGLPWLACCEVRRAAELALATLLISHLLVQLAKRTVGRGRPSIGCDLSAAIREPDRFSFPSGHATASLAIALSYAVVFPLWAGPLLLLALLVGFSRIRLGVHYPSDVLAGQIIAIATALGVRLAVL